MLLTLRAEMARRFVTNAMLAEWLNCTPETALRKLSGKSKIDFDEAVIIKNNLEKIRPLEPNMTIETLFEREEV